MPESHRPPMLSAHVLAALVNACTPRQPYAHLLISVSSRRGVSGLGCDRLLLSENDGGTRVLYETMHARNKTFASEPGHVKVSRLRVLTDSSGSASESATRLQAGATGSAGMATLGRQAMAIPSTATIPIAALALPASLDLRANSKPPPVASFPSAAQDRTCDKGA